MAEYTIDKGIEVPTVTRTSDKYPFGKMKVGDSFLIPKEEQEPKKAASRLSSAAQKFRDKGMSFTMRTLTEGVRIWRIK